MLRRIDRRSPLQPPDAGGASCRLHADMPTLTNRERKSSRSPNRPQTYPKSTPNPPQSDPKPTPNRSQTDPKYTKHTSKSIPIRSQIGAESTQNRPQINPKSIQNLPKSTPSANRPLRKHGMMRSQRSAAALASIWGAVWCPASTARTRSSMPVRPYMGRAIVARFWITTSVPARGLMPRSNDVV